jgi:hypothetical protein
MEYEAIKKWVTGFGIIFIVSSIIELINTFLLLNTQVSFKGKTYTMQELFFSSGRMPPTTPYIFVFLVCSICCFLIFGFLLIKIVSKDIDYRLMAKYLLVLGVLTLLFSYIKLGYITYIERGKVNLNGEAITFGYFVWKYNTSIIGPYSLLIVWTFYTGVVCAYLIIGLVLSGGGLSWILELAKQEAK